MAYLYSTIPSVEMDYGCSRTWLYDYLGKFGFFENKECEFKDEVLRIFHWFMNENDLEPKLTDIQGEYMSSLYEEIETIGETLNVSHQEIYETYDIYYSKYNYSVEDRIKDVLDEQGLSVMYFKAPEDNYALIVNYFGAQNFFPDILKHLVRRRAY